MPKVSVVIPAFNALRYLPRTVDSALAQSFGDFEVLIVDDESTDGTADWVRTIADRRVRLLEQKNQGAAAARNAGIRQARGEYIAFLDADDLWEPAKLERQVACLDARPEVGVVYTWVRVIDQDGEPTGSLYRPGDEEGSGRSWCGSTTSTPARPWCGDSASSASGFLISNCALRRTGRCGCASQPIMPLRSCASR